MVAEQEQYEEVAFYTLAHSDPGSIHQNVVDAFAAQTTTEADKPIRLAFALIGLYLTLEKNYTGRQVQLGHMQLGKYRREWPRFAPPAERGKIRVGDVLAAAPGAKRDAMILTWCAAVWVAWAEAHEQIAELCEHELGIKV